MRTPSWKPRIAWTAVAALALLPFLSASGSAQSLSFPALSADAPVGAGAVQPCTAAGLVGTARCGVFRVWENRLGPWRGGR
ncbi:MAG: hypothetical protein ACRENB_14325 [Gemmatimonadales bacterium]